MIDGFRDDRARQVTEALEAVRRCLARAFAHRLVLGPVPEAGQGSYLFTLPGHPPYHLAIAHEFLTAYRLDEIPRHLDEWGVSSLVASAAGRRVTVTRAGLRLGPA